MKFLRSKSFGKKAFVTLSALTLALGLTGAAARASADTGGDQKGNGDNKRYYMDDNGRRMNDDANYRFYRDDRGDRGDREGRRDRHSDRGDHRGDREGDRRGDHGDKR